MGNGANTEQVVRKIHRRTRRRFSPEEKVRVHMSWFPWGSQVIGAPPHGER